MGLVCKSVYGRLLGRIWKMKKELPLLIVFVSGLFMAVQFFVPHGISEFIYEFVMEWTIIIGIFALALGIWSQPGKRAILSYFCLAFY